MSADELAAAVEAMGALPVPVPVGPELEAPGRDRLRAAFVEALDNAHHTHPCPEYGKPYWTGCVHYDETGRVSGVGSCHNERRADAVLVVRDAEVESLRARVAELEAERKKYVGVEPTIAEEMAYLSRCIDSVLGLCDEQDKAARLFDLPQPEWVARVREAADGLVERASYPPAFPWARLMDDEDRAEFLDELAESATTHASSDVVLAEVEETCKTWRLIAEAQHGHNTAPGPDAPTQALRADAPPLRGRALLDALTVERAERTHNRRLGIEDPHDSPLHHDYRVGRDLPELGGPR